MVSQVLLVPAFESPVTRVLQSLLVERTSLACGLLEPKVRPFLLAVKVRVQMP